VSVTAGNLRQNHLYVNKLHDFLPKDVVGAASRKNSRSGTVEIHLDGLNETVTTDIGSDARTGKPRNFLRGRGWVRRFFEHHRVAPGTLLAFEKLAERKYRLSVQLGGQERRPRVAEFFAGIGLVRLALERQGWQVVFANDIDPDKAEMYRHNWPQDDHLVVGDIHKLDVQSIPTCDLFTASFPCNDLSIAGRWEGLSGKESSAFWGFVQILRDLGKRRPRLVLLENVVGFLMSHGGKDFAEALAALNKLGYSVDAFILNAIHWVPQSRARLFIVGAEPCEQTCGFQMQSDARPDALIRFIVAHPEIGWNLRPLPSLPRPTSRLADIVDKLPDDDPHWWNQERADYFMGQLSDRHAAAAALMIQGREVTYATAFRRVRHGRSMAELRTDGIAGCLRTPRGGSGRQILFKAGKGRYQVRLLTARECARLQGVPDSYHIAVPLNQALFGFGDAVCVPAVEWIIQNYLNPLAGTSESRAPLV
jgi:DNA (cytosine-5)-methyltransferase 1